MESLNDYSDERMRGFCIFCGGPPETREHVPSRFLLDDPLPDNLHIVDSCRECNNGFSNDEEYLGCLLEVVKIGSTENLELMRPKVRRTMERRPHWAHEIERGRRGTVEHPVWEIDVARVQRVVLKYAQCHAAYELAESSLWTSWDWESRVGIAVLPMMEEQDRSIFEAPLPQSGFYPEVGSKALQRMFQCASPWIIVQDGKYRYQTSVEPIIRIVIDEYLACEVTWEEAID